MFNVKNENSLASVMSSYHSYIAEMATIGKPVWVEPYLDAFGFSRVITVSVPIYYQKDSTTLRIIVGVAAIDITM